MNPAVSSPVDRLRLEESLGTSHRWQAYHVFYGGPPSILLQECLAPLAHQLIDLGLITEFFFINYWVEGSHVRLRLRVPKDVQELDVDRLVRGRVEAYLSARPSLHPMAALTNPGFYEQLFQGEYTEADRSRFFDSKGQPVLAPNNTVQKRRYEPELSRYGGRTGLLLSERHFVASTAQVLDVIERGNTNVRPLLLGAAAQLTWITASALLRDEERLRDFFITYHRRWTEGSVAGTTYTDPPGLREHQRTVERLTSQVLPLLGPVREGRLEMVPTTLRKWASVNIGTREEIEAAVVAPGLTFDTDDGPRTATDVDDAAWSLCHSLIHMTNNRLMVSVADEAFLAFQFARALGQLP